jgi:hypothetical protein
MTWTLPVIIVMTEINIRATNDLCEIEYPYRRQSPL